MKKIFVNLKRFEVSRELGGVCPMSDPIEWTRWIMNESIRLNLGSLENVFVTYFLPEALIPTAIETLSHYRDTEKARLAVGCQSVFRDDIRAGANFGAFTTNRPATAMRELGCAWTIIAHSEERRDKTQILAAYDPEINTHEPARAKADDAVDRLLNEQVKRAVEKDMKIVFCIGETAEQKGNGDFDVYAPRVRVVLERQLSVGLKEIDPVAAREIVIGYEPMWAIGPGKTPPNADYIGFVSSYVKEVTSRLFGQPLAVIYGGGLKEENAKSIAGVETVDGGLIALTKFTQPIGFDPESLKNIVMAYIDN